MPLFFNLKNLLIEGRNDPTRTIKILKRFYEGNIIVKNSRDIKVMRSLKGNSYLLNPEALFKSDADILFKMQYLILAGKRDYSLYYLYKYKALTLSYYPDLNLDSIKYNPLLIINTTEIKFKYEE